MDPERRAFYEYHAALMEPWDGPAAIAFTDGRQIGATLDRNGLRPARYVVTDDHRVIMASEVGVLDIPEERIVRKWRLQPGRMLLVDLEQGRIIGDEELKAGLAASRPWQRMLDETQIRLADLPSNGYAEPAANEPLLQRQQAFGYTREDIEFLMAPMAEGAEEAVGSMGADNPVAVLSSPPEAARELLPAELRAGHQPGHRLHPRAARDVPHLDHRAAAEPPRPRAGRGARPGRGRAADPHQPRPAHDPGDRDPYRGPVPLAHHRHLLPRGGGGGRNGGGAGPRLRGGRGGGARPLQHPHPLRPLGGRLPRADPFPARDRRRAPPPRAGGAPHRDGAHRRVRRGEGGPPLQHPRRLRSGGGEPLARLRDPGLARPREAAQRSLRGARGPLHQGDRQGPAQGHGQDGDLDLPVVLRGADLRRGGALEPVRGQVLHRDRDPGRGNRHRGDRRRRDAAPRGGVGRRAPVPRCARPRRRLRVPGAGRGPHVDAAVGREAPARGSRRALRHLPGILRPHQRAERAAPHPARALRVPVPGRRQRQRRRWRRGSSRRSGARRLHRQAVLDRRDVVRVDLVRGAHQPRDRDEPDRRAVEHRRRGRAVGPVPAAPERRFHAFGDQAGGVRALRGDHRVPRQRRRAPDQDRAGREAGRGRAASRAQGRPHHRAGSLLDAGGGPHLPAAAP